MLALGYSNYLDKAWGLAELYLDAGIPVSNLIEIHKEYPQAYYNYEFWSRAIASSNQRSYIPKRLLPQFQKIEGDKAPVQEILELLGIV